MVRRKLQLFGFLVLALAVITGACNQDNKKSDSAQDKKAVKQDSTEGRIIPDKKVPPRLVYDDKGQVIERHAYSYRKKDGSIRSFDSFYYTRDENGNVIKEVKESYDPEMNLQYKNVNYYTYDDRNLMTELRFESYNAEGDLQRTAHHTYKYNERGHKIEDIGYFEDGSIQSKIILDPDETGALRSEEFIHYNPDGSKKDHKKYYYTSYGLERTVDLMKEEDK
ncbi:MAG: hypothetical protein Kow00127_06890 [Bacteroidales bacterium]